LFTALRLHQAGMDVEIYEQSGRIRSDHRADLRPPARTGNPAPAGGLAAGFAVPQFSIRRGRLQSVLYEAAVQRLGQDAVRTGHRLLSFDQSDDEVRARFAGRDGATLASAPVTCWWGQTASIRRSGRRCTRTRDRAAGMASCCSAARPKGTRVRIGPLQTHFNDEATAPPERTADRCT
jgi:hypothetical protein